MKYPQLVSMPSAVSDWLEEQLEARGIDAVVYTRYILSLLHTDSVDVICSDEDLHFSHFRKEVRRSGGGRKRIRRSSEWWRHGQTDPEKLKRSAAVECLMSASEQTYGIESLIDELCEKLKAVKSDVHTPADPPLPKKNLELQRVSPQELAQRYYAAFPPLSRNSSNSPSKLISLVPKWIPSPKKKNIAAQTITNRRFHNNNKAILNSENKFHTRMDLEMKNHHHNHNHSNYYHRIGKTRLGGYFNRNKKEIGRNFSKTVDLKNNKWDLNAVNMSNKVNDYWPENNDNLKCEKMATEMTDQCVETNEWNNDDDTMYDDMRQNISDLLAENDNEEEESKSSLQHDDNMANMRDTSCKGFIQHGIGITNSIWSNNDGHNDKYDDNDLGDFQLNSFVALQTLIDMQFKAVSLDDTNYKNMKNDWITEYNVNKPFLYEQENISNDCKESEWITDFLSKPADCNETTKGNNVWNYSVKNEKWSEASGSNGDDPLTISLIKINHCRHSSPFVEVNPKPKSHTLNVSSTIATTNNTRQGTTTVRTIEVAVNNKDDLFNSLSCHFRPIKESENNAKCEYSDGQTFSINRAYDRVTYRRTPSGGLYLENDYALKRKYYEYKNNNSNNNMLLPFSSNINAYPAFGLILKFMVSPNDKECQTEDYDTVITQSNNKFELKLNTNNKFDKSLCFYQCKCSKEENNINCPVHSGRSKKGFLNTAFEKKEYGICKKCFTNWKSDLRADDSSLEEKKLDYIWGGDSIWSCEEVCRSCLGRPPSTLQQSQLRESVSQDGDQLLSEIGAQMTSIQQAFRDGISPTMDLDIHFNINEILPRSDRKYNSLHDYEESSGPWSFATRIEEDCFNQLSAMPSLRCTL